MKLDEIRKQAKLYEEIKENHAPDGEYFFAFSDGQFEKGLKEIRETSQEEVFKSGGAGLFGTRKGLDEFYAHYGNVEKRVQENCSPLGIFYYEYYNHEGGYGDDETWEITKEYFPDFDFSAPENVKAVKAVKDEWLGIIDKNFGGDVDDYTGEEASGAAEM